jgi:hypothetical protein
MNYTEQINAFQEIAKQNPGLSLYDIMIANEVSSQFETYEGKIDINKVCSIVDDMYQHCDTITSLENVVQAVRTCLEDDHITLEDIKHDDIIANLVW